MATITWPDELPIPEARWSHRAGFGSRGFRSESGHLKQRRLNDVQPASASLSLKLNGYQLKILDDLMRSIGSDKIAIPMPDPATFFESGQSNQAPIGCFFADAPRIREAEFDRFYVDFQVLISDVQSAAQSNWQFYSSTPTDPFYNAPGAEDEFYIERQSIT